MQRLSWYLCSLISSIILTWPDWEMLGCTTGRGLELVEVEQAGLGAEELELEFLGSFDLAECEEPGAGNDLLAA